VSPPLHHERSRANKRNKHFHPPGFQLLPANLTELLLFSQLSRKLHDPKTIAHSCIRNAFPKIQTKCPKSNCIPKAGVGLRRQTHTQILSTYPIANLCPKPEPYARILSAFPRSNKCAPGSYTHSGASIRRVWRAAQFSNMTGYKTPFIVPNYKNTISRRVGN